MYSVFFHPLAHKELESLDSSVKDTIKKKLKELEQFPERGKHLQHSRFWSLRIGDYRAIYETVHSEKKIIVLFVGHRKDVYEDFSKLF